MDSEGVDCDGTTLEASTRADEEGSTASETISTETLEVVSNLEIGKEGVINEGSTTEIVDKGVAGEVGKTVDNQRSKEGLSEPVE